jgi:hypothetical protein
MNKRSSLLLVYCAGTLAACHSPQSDWAHASAANTIVGYQTFLTQHPADPHDAQARQRIAQLEDDAAWNKAQVASDVGGYRAYLAAEPHGAHTEEARSTIQTRERAAAWDRAQHANTVEALQAFIQQYPNTDEADEAHAALRHLAAYRVELATAHSRSAADRERRALAKRFSKTVPEVIVLMPDPSAPEYRITSRPMTEQDADDACARLKSARQACKVIQSNG